MSFNIKLTELLKTDARFVDAEGELILAAVLLASELNGDVRLR